VCYLQCEVLNLPGLSHDALSVLDGADLVFFVLCGSDVMYTILFAVHPMQCEVLNLPGPSSDSPSVLDGANLVYCMLQICTACSVRC
jgi:hypothetical protein